MQIKTQQGVGLLEVLVALMLLAIAVLGFVALQLRAVEATSEGFNRIQAMNIARDLAEKIRMNNSSDAISAYQDILRNNTATSQASSTGGSCYTSSCSPADKARSDARESFQQASNAGMTLSMMVCPATSSGRQCIYVAWGKTQPTDTTVSDSTSACTRSTGSSFAYVDNSTCIVMETY
ncbi:type IV pilus modification protein PilV [Acinetobacter sp. MD2(2019)]|uniref:type IV pilus modification protein PilV n=1 Tax=Acinetobacter sp. MD2(2019) TaxID=2605273 RepID=UPI002D1EBD23|nr:type IV pilus modification protein PilV [Acinetobacter sp. MD2(2019)]MEB3753249.1 type IV pilus modification protein PilV [Acinetobacter sp. MD2(2019)]